MLSTLSSLLPSALSEKLEKLDLRSGDNENKQQQHVNAGAATEDGEESKPKDAADEVGKKEKKKRTTTNEASFCPSLGSATETLCR